MMAIDKKLSGSIYDREFEKFTEGLRVRSFNLQSESEGLIAPNGAILSAEILRLIGGTFGDGNFPNVTWVTTTTGSGQNLEQFSEATLRTGTTANSAAQLQSVSKAELVANTYNDVSGVFRMPGFSNSDVIREFGLFDPVNNVFSGDGVFFRNNSGQMSLVRRKAGVDNVINEVDFNGGNDLVKNDSNNLYEFIYDFEQILFFQNRKLIHIIRVENDSLFQTIHLPIAMRIENINGNTTDNRITSGGFACSRLATPAAEKDAVTLRGTSSRILKNSPGQLTRIVINDIGIGGATLNVYDNTAAVGSPIVSLDLTDNQVDLNYERRFDKGLFVNAIGSGFEVVVVWR